MPTRELLFLRDLQKRSRCRSPTHQDLPVPSLLPSKSLPDDRSLSITNFGYGKDESVRKTWKHAYDRQV